ncbi:hypothetical protein SKAU_G00236240 [Synaphobranchus kaupii]|uniref:Uncharacterized protein n=1 Tax=Synaphobranchus kaupii TaxID=118154 RepID=A0A9Q1IRQ8_SYNKA|nr:hypothetical protein SKAU_G00236240 [Synaphobranchus kaupii]
MQRCVKNPDGTWLGQAISVPEPVLEYNRYMGGVDLLALIKYYSVSLHFVDIAVVNSFIIHKELAKLADVGKDSRTERDEDDAGGDSGSPTTGGGSREEATGLFPFSGHRRELL